MSLGTRRGRSVLKNSPADRLARELKAWRLRLTSEPNVAGRRRKNEETENKLERAHRPDYHFAVVSVALMVFMLATAAEDHLSFRRNPQTC